MRFLAQRRHNHAKSRKESGDADLGRTFPLTDSPDPRSFPSLAARAPELVGVPTDYLVSRWYDFNKALFESATGDPPRDREFEDYCARMLRVIDRELDARDE